MKSAAPLDAVVKSRESTAVSQLALQPRLICERISRIISNVFKIIKFEIEVGNNKQDPEGLKVPRLYQSASSFPFSFALM